MTVRENVKSNTGSVELHAIDTAVITQDPNLAATGTEFPDGAGNQLSVVTDGTDVDEDFVLTDGATVQGATTVALLAGDDLLVDAGASVIAGTHLTIRGDHGNADTGGTHINIEGVLTSTATANWR